MPIELSGITWNHTRGYLSMVSTAQRFSELHPEVSIAWNERSLQQFADAALSEPAAAYNKVITEEFQQ